MPARDNHKTQADVGAGARADLDQRERLIQIRRQLGVDRASAITTHRSPGPPATYEDALAKVDLGAGVDSTDLAFDWRHIETVS